MCGVALVLTASAERHEMAMPVSASEAILP
jgi:hypothetical protein